MDGTIALILAQDGVVNGAIYALLAISLVLVFAVTRVVFVPQGEFVAFGALTYALLNTGTVPGSLWLLCGLGGAAAAVGLFTERGARRIAKMLGETLLLPAGIAALTVWLAPQKAPLAVQAALAVAIVAPMALFLHRLAFQPLARSSVLALLIAAVGVHFALVGLGLVVFGPEGSRAQPFGTSTITAGPLIVPGQALWVIGASAALAALLFGLFAFTLTGKALRATAVNRLGAQLVGIPIARSGRIAFALAGFMGALCGVLTAPLTTIYYDTGFLIGLKGFVAAIVGGLASYPLAAAAAVILGIGESFAAFWASAFKEVIVFTAVLPILLVRSLAAPHAEEDE